jgi:hypothetical protein
MPRKQIKELITELRTWLPDYQGTEYANSFYRILASLPGGDELVDMGYEPLPDINFREADQIARVLEAVGVGGKRDVQDLIAGLTSEDEDLHEGVSETVAEETPRFGKSNRSAREVWLNGKHVDTVFFDPSMTDAEVRDSLIHHDGYSPDIQVKRQRQRASETVTEKTPVAEETPIANESPRSAPANEDAVHELALYTINDGDIYRQTIQPIIKNLAKKVRNGTYDAEKAVQAWSYAADAGAQRYTKEFGGTGNGSYGAFSKADRMAAAKEIGEHFEEEVQTASKPDRRLNETPVVRAAKRSTRKR